MNNLEKSNQNRISKLEKLIKDKQKENELLIIHKKNLYHHTLRYKKIFDKSYISMWEEDASEVYKILESLPCKTGEDLSEYLSSHSNIIIQLVQNLKILEINDYTALLFGTDSKDEFLNTLNSGRIHTHESFPGFIKFFAAMLDGVLHCRHGITTYSIDGTKLDLIMAAYLPGKGNGNILISMMDITKRKHNEDTLTNTIKQAEEQNERTKVLQNILLTLTSSLDKEEILNAILREARKIIPYSSANIRLLENGYLKVAAIEGYDDYGVNVFMQNSAVIIDKLGNASKFLNSGKIRVISDTRNYPDWKVFPETSYVLSYIGIPIKRNNKTIGLLSLESDKTDTFIQSDTEMLELFSQAVALALQSSNLFELAQKEIKKREKTEASIKKSLREKEILLREIHHRVKNNLTLIMSLINLQSGMLSDKIDPFILEDLKQKVYTIALVHEKLHNSKNLLSVDLKSYLIDLAESVKASSIFRQGIEFIMEIENGIEIESDTLVPLALLLNELIVNSVKHAFPEKPGLINIKLYDDLGNHKIIFRDNGIGLPDNRNKSSTQMGLFLVESLIDQIGGTISFTNDFGAVSTIIFPGK